MRILVTRTIRLLAGVVVALGVSPAGAQQGFEGARPGFAVVVHPSVPGTQIEKQTLSAIFLRQVTRWPDGSTIKVVDQSARSPIRADFSEHGLGQAVAAVTNYWARQISAGKGLPPPVKTSDAEVLAYVKANEGAIGYVAAAAAAAEPAIKVIRLVQ